MAATRTRTRRVDPDALADDLDRVLKVSQPKVRRTATAESKPVKPKPAAKPTPKPVAKPAAKPVTKPATRPAAKAATKPAPNPAERPAAKSALQTATTKPASAKPAPTTRPASTKPAPRRAAKAPTTNKEPAPTPPSNAEDDFPWLRAGALSPRERAVAAQSASNDALRLLGEAAQAGFKYTQAPSSSAAGGWTRARAEATLLSGQNGLAVLRELYSGPGSTVSRRATVEKGAMALVTRCIALEMHIPALGLLVDVRPHILALYEHGDDKPRAATPPLTEAWAPLLDLPPPTCEVDDALLPILASLTLAAWCCLLPLGLNPETLPSPSPSPSPLHPFTLAPTLPLAAVGQLAVYLYRAARDDGYTPGTAAWLQLRRLGAFAGALSASGTGDARNSPERVWSAVRRTAALHLEKGGDGAPRDVAEYITCTVDVVEAICAARGEAHEAWFCGHWEYVLDLWMDLGRTLGDSAVIERALSAATATVCLASSSGSSSPAPTSAPTSAVSTPRRSTVPQVPNAGSEATKLFARLTKLVVDMSAPGVSVETRDASLASVEFDAILGVLCSLKPSARTQETTTSLLRAVERLRRLVKSLNELPQTTSTTWLQSYVNFAVRLLQQTQSSDMARECMPGLVETATILMRLNTTESSAISPEQLDAIFAALEAHSAELDPAVQAQYASCLIHGAYSIALSFSKTAVALAIAFARRACEWSRAVLARLGDDDVARKFIANPLSKRYELLGFCLQQGADKSAALHAFVHGCLCLDAGVVRQISAGAASKPLRHVFAELSEFATAVKRTTSLLAHETALGPDLPTLLAAALNDKQWSPAATGAVLEQIADALESSQFLPHVQDAMCALLRMALDLYEADTYPVRRLRVIARLVSVIVSTGAGGEQYESLRTEADALVKARDLARDAGLVQFRQEYYATIVVHAALQTYHQPEMSPGLAQLGRAALDASRAVIFPPAPTAKRVPARMAPAPKPKTAGRSASRKVTPTTKAAATDTVAELDDAERLSALLNALAALFGLLGYIVPKIEALNLLRAMQRTHLPDAYIATSAQVAAEYGRLGKVSRAAQVFAKAQKQADGAAPAARAELHLRHARFLAAGGHAQHARAELAAAARVAEHIAPPARAGTFAQRWIQICAATERMALAYAAAAAISMAEEDATSAVAHLAVAYRLWSRAAAGIAHIAAEAQEPAGAPAIVPAEDGAAEGKDKEKDKKQAFCFVGKRLGGLQWYFAEALFEATFDIALALAQQGSVKECEYYLNQARGMVSSVRSSTLDARTASHTAEFETRRLNFEKTAEQIDHAVSVLTVDGPEAVEIQRIKGELFSRQAEGLAADELFAGAVEHLVGLDKEFMSAETKMPSARKDSIMPAASLREPLLPLSLGHMLRQRAWLMREGGNLDAYDAIVEQLNCVPRSLSDTPDQLLLEARVAMHDAFKYFKTDLFMSSLTESTIALTMGSPGKRGKDRLSTRHDAVQQLERASAAFRNTLATIAARGRVEDVRQTCVSLALLGAFQTSLGHGSPATTASAASTLASVSSITLHRQLLAAIDSKYPDAEADDMDWPVLDAAVPEPADALQAYWADVRARHADVSLVGDYDLSALPTNWAVVSITVTDDRNTMLVTRHQNGHEAIVFCIPLDRQGRRDGDDESELFSFDAGIAEMRAIMAAADANLKSGKGCESKDDRKAWWRERHELDTRLSELLATIEFCWLGAFKTVLNPRLEFDADALATFRARLDRIFHAAITAGGSDARKAARVRLNDTLLACFATLSSKCRDEEVEDLVYFVLDLYQFHGIAVALAELDFDQIGVDVKAALADLELATGMLERGASDEHLLLALDKNVQSIPWESIPILRGRAVSRIASLPLLLDQVALGATLGADAAHRTLDARNTHYIVNPGGDLPGTQERFGARLRALEADGWAGIAGRPPTEAEMVDALTHSELVMYLGHGGGEAYLRSHKVRALRRCAATMLWGCSSGMLREHGDLDPTGTPHDYLLAGAPCLVANLWDVTDKDIDRVTVHVMDTLGLQAGKIGKGAACSIVQAVSQGRSAARLPYLTGAAVVVYGVPVYLA